LEEISQGLAPFAILLTFKTTTTTTTTTTATVTATATIIIVFYGILFFVSNFFFPTLRREDER